MLRAAAARGLRHVAWDAVARRWARIFLEDPDQRVRGALLESAKVETRACLEGADEPPPAKIIVRLQVNGDGSAIINAQQGATRAAAAAAANGVLANSSSVCGAGAFEITMSNSCCEPSSVSTRQRPPARVTRATR